MMKLKRCWACSIQERRKMHTEAGLENLNGTDNLEGLGVVWEGNIKVDLKEIVGVGIDWINLAEYRFPLEAFVNMVMNISIPYDYAPSCRLLPKEMQEITELAEQ